ncbi:MAG: 4-(cytidine 5'-diphospho)-2-C-methyl-D-erythritol kinase [Chitinivibrionales bacterium]|nr:4-(cytidine 5'-diphospho)-2-C-methyl-D-erythritol kinase [Chitinivibrionales bacterium]
MPPLAHRARCCAHRRYRGYLNAMSETATHELRKDSHTRITLALDILRRLTDGPCAGYHELAVVKHRIDLHDSIVMADAAATGLRCDDPRVPTGDSNLCLRAVALVRQRFGIERHVAIELEKRIPLMGGLAGGSANAATTLEMLNELWELGLGVSELRALGRELGMDVPYYFGSATALDIETTSDIRPLPDTLTFHFVLVVPTFGVSTPQAYAGLDYDAIGRSRSLTDAMLEAWQAGDRERVLVAIHNDFEQSIFARHPELGRIRESLLSLGCEAAWMSGSGSTIVGVVADREQGQAVRDALTGRALPIDRVLLAQSLEHE